MDKLQEMCQHRSRGRKTGSQTLPHQKILNMYDVNRISNKFLSSTDIICEVRGSLLLPQLQLEK